ILWKAFSASIGIIFVFGSVYVVDYVDRLAYVEPALHPWDEAYLITKDKLFGVLLQSVCTGLNTRIVQAEEGISEVKVQLNEIKREEKIREKRIKRNEQSLQEMWDYVKKPNLRLIGVPECDGENESKLENTLQDIIQENFPKLAKQVNIQPQVIQRTPQRYSSRRATPRHIIIRFTRVETKEKI
uniref:Uncharacterized protein n=1 Tax=Callithrix jacchus TaxID=9483 RepID=A0A5F4WMR8_CALJA